MRSLRPGVLYHDGIITVISCDFIIDHRGNVTMSTMETLDIKVDSALPVDRLIIGCSSLAGLHTSVGEHDVQAAIQEAVTLGCREFDTAPHYGLGLSEERVGRALKLISCPQGYKPVVWTKVGRVIYSSREEVPEEKRADIEEANCAGSPTCIFPTTDPNRVPVFDYTSAGVALSLAGSRARLDCELAGIRLHDCETPERIAPALAPGGALDELAKMKIRGEVPSISLGMNDPSAVLKLLREWPPSAAAGESKGSPIDNVMLAGRWNLLDQNGIDVLIECQRQGIEVHNAGIFASGLLANFSTPDDGGATSQLTETVQYRPATPSELAKAAAWKELAFEYGVSLATVALGFACLPKCVSRVAVGVKNAEEVNQAVAAALALPLPPAIWTEATKRGLLPRGLCEGT